MIKKNILLLMFIFLISLSFSIKLDEKKINSAYEYAIKNYAKYNTKNLEIYFEKNANFSPYIVKIALYYQNEINNLIKIFKIKIFNKKIPVILFDTRKEIVGLSEYQVGGFWNNKVVFGTPVNLKHEIVHAIDFYTFKGENPFFKEGLANWFKYINDGLDLGSKYHFYVKYMIKYSQEYRNLNYEELYKKIFLNWKNGYTFGASFIGFFIEEYGINRFKNFYINLNSWNKRQLKENIIPYMINWIKWLKDENNTFNYSENFIKLCNKEENKNINLKKFTSIKNIYYNDFYYTSNNRIILNKNINGNLYSYTAVYDLDYKKVKLYKGTFVTDSKNYLLTINNIVNINFYNIQKKSILYKINTDLENISKAYISESERKIFLVNGKKIKEYKIENGEYIKTIDYDKYISTINEIDGNIIYGTTDGNIIMENKITKISNEPIRKIVETEKYIIILSGMDELSILEKNTLKIIKNINNNEYIHDISINKKIQALYILYEKGIIQKINLKDFKIEYEKNAGFDPLKNKVILTDKYFIKSDEDYINFYLLEEGKKENEIKYEQIKLKKYKECEENIMYYEYQNGYEIIENEYAELTIKKEDQTILKKELEDYLSKVKIVKDKLFISCENGVIEIYDLKTGELLYKDKKIQKIADFDGKYIYYGNKNNEIVKYDYKNKKELKKYKGHYGIIQAINLTKDNKYIISYNGLSGSINSNPGNRILIHTLGKEAYIRSITILNPIKKTIILKDGYQLLIEDTKSNIFIYNILNGKLENIIMHPLKNIKALDINENKLIITDGEKIMIYNITTGEIEKALITKEFINNMKYIEDNKIAIIVDNIIYINEGNK
ncbi:WD40 repeat domain-containing protein [Marinitoga aeolica]|uniref:Uncharacterized protein n=1 Tax=Marinitoga aeolica TaxID=2809031 RepID=A0ABY8PN99_9BACT|nr:hypothetical protein [Marinitoga aeolica]WGS64115.1 hypothetical protein JRV97_06945 [Marinitoga aeolica]